MLLEEFLKMFCVEQSIKHKQPHTLVIKIFSEVVWGVQSMELFFFSVFNFKTHI